MRPRFTSTGRSKLRPFQDTSCGTYLLIPSKKRCTAAPSPTSGSPREKMRRPSSFLSTHEITTTRCRCGGRKSLAPLLCTRRFWNATSATSRSDSSAGRPWILRMPSQSGMVSMSKTRIGVIQINCSDPFSIGENTGREIAVAAVADDGDHDRVLQLFRHAQRHMQRAAGGDAGEDALLAREAPRHLLGLGLAHALQAVDAGTLVDLGQIGLRPLADAGDLRALLGLAADHLDRALLLLEKARAPHDGAGGAHARDEMGDAALGIAPDLGAGGFVMHARIIRVGELVEHRALALTHHLLGQIARRLHAARLRREDDLRAEGAHRL